MDTIGTMCSDIIKNTNSANIIKILKKWFNILGFPKTIRSDWGPQFRTESDTFCNDNNIIHELSSPYNPSSNGLVEQAFKTAKHLIKKVRLKILIFKKLYRCGDASPKRMASRQQKCSSAGDNDLCYQHCSSITSQLCCPKL